MKTIEIDATNMRSSEYIQRCLAAGLTRQETNAAVMSAYPTTKTNKDNRLSDISYWATKMRKLGVLPESYGSTRSSKGTSSFLAQLVAAKNAADEAAE